MTSPRIARHLALLTALAAAYAVAGILGLRLGLLDPTASAVWAPTGLAIAACILLGTAAWPAIFAGALVVGLSTTRSVPVALAIAVGNTLEAVVGAWLVARWADGRHAFDTGAASIRYAALTALGATLISPTIGVGTLALAHLIPAAGVRDVWLTWWLGDAAGALLVAPPLILWANDRKFRWPHTRWVEAGALAVALLATSGFAYSLLARELAHGHALGFLVLPPLIWAAVRFGPREASTGVALVAAVAVADTIWIRHSDNESLVLLQAFMGVTAVTIMALAGAVLEGRRVEGQLRQLAITDPLTGLANYREFISAVESELQRSERSDRPFAVVLFDLDRLKRVNDLHGHLVGSRALCRLAEAIRSNCRTIDTPARLGGDEFALVLPETDRPEADQVAERIRLHLEHDAEIPSISGSTGVAIYPDDGATVEALIGTADRALYGMKRAQVLDESAPTVMPKPEVHPPTAPAIS